MTHIGTRIGDKRREKGLTQAQLAEKVQMDRTYLAKVEKGKHVPSIALMERIAVALDCSLKDLL